MLQQKSKWSFLALSFWMVCSVLAQSSDVTLEQQLRDKPEEADVLVPKIEQAIIDKILASGVGSRFAIAGVEATSDPPCSATIEEGAGDILMFDTEFTADELIFQPMGGPMVLGHKSVHRYNGEINAPIGDFTHFVSDDDKTQRLTFAVLEGVGYVYLRGKGRVVRADGSEVVLGNEQP